MSTLQSKVPGSIWSASSLGDTTRQLLWGQTLDLECPAGTKPSFDDDGVAENDDLYSIVCHHEGFYPIPETWPECVPSCWVKVPDPPDYTGLEPVVPTNTIPGQETRNKGD